jgi:excisionase family DNA binding protein
METTDFQRQLDRIEATALSQKNVLTFDEAVKFTGLSKSYLYKLTSRQEVPHSKPRAKLLYFDRAELEKWLLQNPITTVGELEQQAVNYCYSGRKGV